jgi:hypothetical protein
LKDLEVAEIIRTDGDLIFQPNKFNNDVVILKLKMKMKITNPNAKPASVPDAKTKDGDVLYVSGWGYIVSYCGSTSNYIVDPSVVMTSRDLSVSSMQQEVYEQ